MVDHTIVVEMTLDLHVLVQLLLGIQSAGETFGVHTFDVDATDSSRALCFPLFDLTVSSYSLL